MNSESDRNATNVSRGNLYVSVNATDNGVIDSIVVFVINSTNDLINTSTGTSSPHTINFTDYADGAYSFNVSANDTFGNVNISALYAVTIDTLVPLIVFNVSSEANATNVSRSNLYVNVSVTEINEDTISFLIINATGVVNSTNLTARTRELNFTDLPDGSYSISVRINDSAGHSNVTETYGVTIDTTNPQIAFGANSDANATNVSRANLYVNVTVNETNFDTLSFLIRNSTGIANSTNVTGTTRALNFSAMPDGAYNITVRVNDSVGHSASTVTYSVTVDTTDPQIAFGARSEANLTNVSRANLYVNVTINETNLDTISFLIRNSTGIVNSTNITGTTRALNFTALPNGVYNITVRVNDSVGHSVSTPTYSATIDTVLPVIAFSTRTETAGVNLSRTNYVVNVSVTETNEDTIIFALSGTTGVVNSTNSTGRLRFINYTGLSQGNYTLNVTINDSAGNVNYTSTYNFIIDTAAPSVSLSKTSATASVMTLAIAIGESGSGINETCTINRAGAIVTNGGTLNQVATESSLACGSDYTYQATCLDSAGNSASSSLLVVNTAVCDGLPAVSSGGGGGSSSASVTPALSPEVEPEVPSSDGSATTDSGLLGSDSSLSGEGAQFAPDESEQAQGLGATGWTIIVIVLLGVIAGIVYFVRRR